MVFGNVVINEIAWMGTAGNRYGEWIELYNTDATEIDLSNWELYKDKDGSNLLVFTLTKKITPNGYLVIERITDSSPDPLPGINDESGKFGGGDLINSPGEHLVLKNADNVIVEDLDFSSGWPTGDVYVAGNNNSGRTMERKNLQNPGNNANNWQTSLSPGGTPKAPNSSGAIEEPSSVPPDGTSEGKPASTINEPPVADAGDNIIGFVNQELTFDGTKSSDPNRDELHYEWNMGNGKLIEIPSFTYMYPYPGTYLITLMVFDGKKYASDTITVQIQQAQITINEFMANSENKDEKTGWIEIYNDADMIMDISSWQLDDAASGSAPFVFPKNTFIAPKSYLTFSQQITNIDLNDDKDSVRLLLPSGIVFQEINYENPLQNKSSARTAEGFVWSEPTPGITNISGLAIKNNKQTVLQMNSVKPQTVKNSSENYIVSLPDNEIKEGYVAISPNNQEANTQTNDLAAIKQPATQNPLNLVFVFVAVIFGSGFIGLLLVKFRKKRPVPSIVEGLPI